MAGIILLLIEDDCEIGRRIATMLQERFSIECVVIQDNEEQLKVDEKIRIGHMGHADLIQALLDDTSLHRLSDPLKIILRNTQMDSLVSFSQSYRVSPKKFADVRKIPIPAQCKGARKKLSK